MWVYSSWTQTCSGLYLPSFTLVSALTFCLLLCLSSIVWLPSLWLYSPHVASLISLSWSFFFTGTTKMQIQFLHAYFYFKLIMFLCDLYGELRAQVEHSCTIQSFLCNWLTYSSKLDLLTEIIQSLPCSQINILHHRLSNWVNSWCFSLR